MHEFHAISISHKRTNIHFIGAIMPDFSLETIQLVKEKFGLSEFFFLNTCNRMLIVYIAENPIAKNQISTFFAHICPNFEKIHTLVDKCDYYNDVEVLNHLFRVTSGLNSMVVGEHEILGQVKKAYNQCREMKIIGDNLRLLFENTIMLAKQIYHKTDIGRHTVSVVALAMIQLKFIQNIQQQKVLILGAGESIQKVMKFLLKFGYQDITIFNRTLTKAEKLTQNCPKASALPITEISKYKKGFDILITCLDNKPNFVDKYLYTELLNGDINKKIVIDLAVPNNIETSLPNTFNIKYVDVESLRTQANKNLDKRKLSLSDAEAIIEDQKEQFQLLLKKRKLERVFSEIPEKMKQVKCHALENVFHKELKETDEETRALIEKMLNYVEKKYISIPMTMSRDAVFKKLDV